LIAKKLRVFILPKFVSLVPPLRIIFQPRPAEFLIPKKDMKNQELNREDLKKAKKGISAWTACIRYDKQSFSHEK
jgi:hypothetical protein